MRDMKGLITVVLVVLGVMGKTFAVEAEKAGAAVEEPLNAIEAVTGDETASDDRDSRSPALLTNNNQNVGVHNQGSLQLSTHQLFPPFHGGQSTNFIAGQQRQSRIRGQQQHNFGGQQQLNLVGQQQLNLVGQQQQNLGSQQQLNLVGQQQPNFRNLNSQNIHQDQQTAGENKQSFNQQNNQQLGENPFALRQQAQNQFSGNQQGRGVVGFPHQGQTGFRSQQSQLGSKYIAPQGSQQASQSHSDRNQQGQNQPEIRSQNQNNNQGLGRIQLNQNQPFFVNRLHNNQPGFQSQLNFGGQRLSHSQGQLGFANINNQRFQGQFHPHQANQLITQNQFGAITGPQRQQPVVALFSNNPTQRACHNNDPNCNSSTHIGVFYPITK